jgi:hypothetical protein
MAQLCTSRRGFLVSLPAGKRQAGMALQQARHP